MSTVLIGARLRGRYVDGPHAGRFGEHTTTCAEVRSFNYKKMREEHRDNEPLGVPNMDEPEMAQYITTSTYMWHEEDNTWRIAPKS